MPILKHAKKKLKQDKKRTIKNKKIKDAYKSMVKKAKADKSPKSLSEAFSAVDKAAKKNILSNNKASRLKASLTKHVAGKAAIHADHQAKAQTKVSAKPQVKEDTKKVVKSAKAAKPAAKATNATGAKSKKTSSKK
jgi:small subunit ribosomal protein S20